MKKQKTLYYFQCEGGNFGDELNKILFEKLFSANLNYCTSIWNADYIGIGSVLGWACIQPTGKKEKLLYPINRFFGKKGKLVVLGSGFIKSPNEDLRFARKMDFNVLRGKLTANFLWKHGYIEKSPTLGDPGLLSSYLYEGNNDKRYKLGIIPHLNDMDSPYIFEIYKKYKLDSIIINVHEDPLCVISQIASCENIFSTSLHGLIIADSFGIPNIWGENQLKHEYHKSNRFKFMDYYSNYEISNINPIQAMDFCDCGLDIIKNNYVVDFIEVQRVKEKLFSYFLSFFKE